MHENSFQVFLILVRYQFKSLHFLIVLLINFAQLLNQMGEKILMLQAKYILFQLLLLDYLKQRDIYRVGKNLDFQLLLLNHFLCNFIFSFEF